MSPYNGALGEKRKWAPFAAVEPSPLMAPEEGVPLLLEALCHMEYQRWGEAASALAPARGDVFIFMIGLANLWAGKALQAFKSFNNVSPPDAEEGEGMALFKAAFANASACLLMLDDQDPPSQARQAAGLIRNMLETVDSEKEPGLAGFYWYHLGRANAVLSQNSGEESMVFRGEAVECFRKSAEISESISPYARAAAMNALGHGLYDPDRGTKESLKEAGACFMEVLEVYDRKSFPSGWAGAQFMLGEIDSTLASRQEGKDKAAALMSSVEAYSLALEEMDQGAPVKWGAAMVRLAGSLASLGGLIGGDQGAGLVRQAQELIDQAEPAITIAGDESLSQGLAISRAAAIMVEKRIGKDAKTPE